MRLRLEPSPELLAGMRQVAVEAVRQHVDEAKFRMGLFQGLTTGVLAGAGLVMVLHGAVLAGFSLFRKEQR